MFGIYYERKITLELWQLYDSVGNETGKSIEANSEIPEGLYHKTVSVWIKNKKEQYLMSKRSPEKQYAYCWECTGGSVQAGENTWEAAYREVYEELGIDISSLTGKKLISKKRKEQKDFYDVWIVYGEFGLHELSPNKTEVIDVKWMDMKEILLLNQYGYLHPLLDYVDVNFFKEEIK